MNKPVNLTQLRLEYMGGRVERKMLEGLIFQYLVDNFERYHLFKGEREKWVDFLTWLYPRLSRAVDYYKERGATFDTYIGSIIRWSYREYVMREAEHTATEYACWKAKAEDMETCSPEPEYGGDDPLDETTAKSSQPEFSDFNDIIYQYALPEYGEEENCITRAKISQRQILLLILKSYYYITDDLLDRIVQITGMEKKEIETLINQLHEMRSEKEAYVRDLQERLHCQYYRCLAFERRLATTYAGTAKYERLTNYLERARTRYLTMRKRLYGIRMGATNQQIASLLNIPKGTVDSALHNVREKWELAKRRDSTAGGTKHAS